MRQVALWRMSVLLVLLAVCVALHAQAGFDVDLAATYVYAVLTVAYLFAAALYVWLRSRPTLGPLVVALSLTADVVAVTAIAGFSGGANSIFGFLYTIVILEAVALGGMRSGLITTTTVSVLFMALAMLHRAGMILHAAYLPFGSDAPTQSDFWVFVAMRVGAFYIVAILSGQLAHRIGHLERQQETLLEHFSTGYLAADPEGRLTFINSAGRRILGLGPAPLLGTPLTEVFRTDPPARNPASLSLQLRKEFFETPCVHWNPDGRQIPLQITTAFIRSRGHRIGGVMAHFSDQTLVHELEQSLRQQDRLALAGELSASLAHEVRNPVAAIRGATQELSTRDRGGRDPIEQQLFNILLRESDQLNRVVTHFLEYARISVSERLPVNVRALLDEVVQFVSREPQRIAGVTVETRWQANGATVAADLGLLKQAFLNITQNALDAMPNGGILRIATQPAPRPGALDIVIEDTGEGMSDEDVKHVFEPFFSTKSSGTGLGLAIVHRIVQAHAGEIHVRSKPGSGTRICVRLPLST